MAIISYREVIPRTASHRFGEAPTAERKYIVTVDEPTPTQTLVNAIGIFHAAAHPEFSYLKCLNIQVTEPDRHHAEITYSYELPQQQELDPNPLARPDVWSFSIGGAQVPALVYYDGSGNGNKLPLVNAAGDFFEGLTTLEAEVRASISGNRPTFPLANASAVTNSVNASPYLGGAAHTWLCAGISGQQATEVVNDVELRYWQITVELVYRASGHDLLLPHVGWHYVTGNGGAKFRTFVRSKDGTDEEASSPQPLNSDGSQKYVGETSGPPDILTRRVYPEANFSTYFGTPPF
jgi:hypothetical protein